MSWDLEVVLWPAVCLLWTVAAVFIIWAGVTRKRKEDQWKEYLWVAAFSLLSSFLMLYVKYSGFRVSYTSRIGLVSIILGLYAYYLYRRKKK